MFTSGMSELPYCIFPPEYFVGCAYSKCGLLWLTWVQSKGSIECPNTFHWHYHSCLVWWWIYGLLYGVQLYSMGMAMFHSTAFVSCHFHFIFLVGWICFFWRHSLLVPQNIWKEVWQSWQIPAGCSFSWISALYLPMFLPWTRRNATQVLRLCSGISRTEHSFDQSGSWILASGFFIILNNLIRSGKPWADCRSYPWNGENPLSGLFFSSPLENFDTIPWNNERTIRYTHKWWENTTVPQSWA